MNKTITLAVMVACALAGITDLFAMEPEPNWTNRYHEIKQELIREFQAPVLGQTVTLTPRMGPILIGRLEGVRSNTVTVEGKTYEQRQLTDRTCELIFPDYRASRLARQQVLEERSRFEEGRLAELRRVQEEAEVRRKAAQAEAAAAQRMAQNAERLCSQIPKRDPVAASRVAPIRQPVQKSGSSNTMLWVLLALCGLIVAVIVAKWQSAAKRKAADDAMVGQANIFLSTVRSQRALKPIPTGLMLKDGENAYLEDACTLHETRSVRHYQSGGVGFRIAKGVYVGGSKGRSVSADEMTRIDSGRLTLTNKKIVFDGSIADRTIPLNKIVSVNNFRDAIEISTEGRQKSVYFTVPNPLIWCAAIKLLASGQDPMSLDVQNTDI